MDITRRKKMAEKKIEKVTTKKEVVKPEKSKRLIPFDEFFKTYPLRAEHRARLKMELDGDLYKSREEWLKLAKQFD